jgi:hypothetical protein
LSNALSAAALPWLLCKHRRHQNQKSLLRILLPSISKILVPQSNLAHQLTGIHGRLSFMVVCKTEKHRARRTSDSILGQIIQSDPNTLKHRR